MFFFFFSRGHTTLHSVGADQINTDIVEENVKLETRGFKIHEDTNLNFILAIKH